MGRPGDVHELDGALLFLASDASTYVTGRILAVGRRVDGGLSGSAQSSSPSSPGAGRSIAGWSVTAGPRR